VDKISGIPLASLAVRCVGTHRYQPAAALRGWGLSGNFLVEFQFEVGELKNWLALYVAEFPEDAIRVLAEMQAEAFILLAKLRPDAKESP